MAGQNWWRNLLSAIDRTYERRIRSASQVSEYGADHHASPDDEGAAEIVNVPRGTRLRRPTAPSADSLPPDPHP